MASRLFLSWRRFLARVLIPRRKQRDEGPPSRPVRTAFAELSAYLRDPSGFLGQSAPETQARLRLLGISALAIGTVGWVLIAAITRTPVAQTALDATSIVVWALLRLLLMRLATRNSEERGRVDIAWGPALVPEMFAIVFPLDVIALGASAWLTYRGLRGLGTPARSAGTTIAWAFGGQLLVGLAAWAARGGLIVLSARF